MAMGKVKILNRRNFFGFISNYETGEDIFVHFSDLVHCNLKEGDEVTFEIKVEGERKKAVNVKKKE
jgi:CspA family cold shock protein